MSERAERAKLRERRATGACHVVASCVERVLHDEGDGVVVGAPSVGDG
jgi:hypothetical protein